MKLVFSRLIIFALLLFPTYVLAEALIFFDDFNTGLDPYTWNTGSIRNDPNTISVIDGKVVSTANHNYIETIQQFSGNLRIEAEVGRLGNGVKEYSCWEYFLELTENGAVGILRFSNGIDYLSVNNSGFAFCADQVNAPSSSELGGKMSLTYNDALLQFTYTNRNGDVLASDTISALPFIQSRLRIWIAASADTPRYVDNVKVFSLDEAAADLQCHADLADAKLTISNLRDGLTQADNTISGLYDDLNLADAEIAKLNAELVSARIKISHVEAALQESTHKGNELNEQLAASNLQIVSLTTQLTESNILNNELKTELSANIIVSEELQKELDNVNHLMVEYTNKIETLSTQNEQSQKTISELEADLEQGLTGLQDILERIDMPKAKRTPISNQYSGTLGDLLNMIIAELDTPHGKSHSKNKIKHILEKIKSKQNDSRHHSQDNFEAMHDKQSPKQKIEITRN